MIRKNMEKKLFLKYLDRYVMLYAQVKKGWYFIVTR